MNKPLKYFVLFSLISHLLFGLLWLTQPENNIQWNSSNEISVVIAQNKYKNTDVRPVSKTNKTAVHKNISKSTKTYKSDKKEQKLHTQKFQPRSKIIAHLQNNILKNFYYPKLAQKKNLEGKVTVGFLLHTTGYLSKIEIIHSSGYEILDNAAIKAISNIARLSNVNVNKDMAIQLPVIYRLSEG